MSHHYDDCRTCGASYEERLNAIKDNGHNPNCFLYKKVDKQVKDKPTDNFRSLGKLHVGYD